MTKRLLEPVLEGGTRHVHFFNGRRLTAEDLRAEQKANQEGRERLGLGLGAGVIRGFEVEESSAPPDAAGGSAGGAVVLNVRAGVAVNRLGQTVELPHDQLLALVAPEATARTAGLFAECEAVPVSIGTGTGAYVLVASPVSAFEGQAPMSGFGTGGRITGCGSRYAVWGVRFNLLPVSFSGDVTDTNTLRNRLAHHIFGTEELLEEHREPFAPAEERLTALVPDLQACDVPLALLFWANRSILFIDHWSVRRRLVGPYPTHDWLPYVGEARRSIAESAFLQFQEEVEWLLGHRTGLKSMWAGQRFRYLPSAGFLPVGHNQFAVDAFFSPNVFVNRIDVESDPAFLRELIHRSWYVEPIPVLKPPPIVIHFVRGVDDYVVFTRQDTTVFRQRDVVVVVAQPEAKGRIEADLALALDAADPAKGRFMTLADAKGSTVADALRAEVQKSLRVAARDALGRLYEGTIVAVGGAAGLTTGKPFARAVFESVDAGEVMVSVQSQFFQRASKSVTVESGKTARLVFVLFPADFGTIGAKPDPGRRVEATWLPRGWWAEMHVMDRYIKKGPLPEEVQKWDVVTDPPPHVRDQLRAWAAWAGEKMPDAPVDPGEIRVLINPEYVPGAVADEPYAYVEFGRNGVNIPVVLVPNETAVAGSVTAQSAGVTGVDPNAGLRLLELGAAEVDVVASAWTGLLRDAGFAQEAAPIVLNEARRRSAELKTSVLTVAGVDEQTAAALAEKGIDSTVKLANADSQTLQQEFGFSAAKADILIAGARSLVPQEFWSVKAGDLNLTGDEVKVLEASGITSKGDLNRLTAETLSEKTGIAVEKASELIERSAEVVDTKRVRELLAEKESVGALRIGGAVELTDKDLVKLAEAGITDVKTVAEADVVKIASVTGDALKAKMLLDAAKARLGKVKP